MNSLEIENVLRAFGFEEKPNSIKSKKFIHSKLLHPVYVKQPSGNTKVDYVRKQPLVVHDSYGELLEKLQDQIVGILPDFDSFYHATSLNAFNKRKRNGKSEIYYGIAVNFNNVEDLVYFISGMIGVENLNVDTSNEFIKEFNTVRSVWRDIRVGQNVFRSKLLDMWKGCSVTGISIKDFLVASHIKPWASSSGSERLDVNNGLLLTPNLDKAFDKGYISFDNNGGILISEIFLSDAESLGINQSMSLVLAINDDHRKYLKWHREHLYKNA
ncbi:HNH endonuclease [Aliivibrio fischeri]|uniref:HNH endonuclease n=1 Tax=Aliivibrio fischeri TaxID=668 RepID=UPI001F247A70|nr:HNH endonuclease [Aliivibrio fischeri]MCE4937471.1 HNH endonuclease [Aliivibrio fischeri]